MRWLCCWLLLLLAGAQAAPPPLTVRVDTTDLRLRRDAPIPLEVQLDNHTPTLRTGRLEAGILHRDRRVGVHRSAEVTLSPGPRTVSLLLPPITGVEAGDGLAVRLRFVAADGAVDLGDHRLGAVNLGGRELVIAIARTDRRLTKLEVQRERSLRLETLRPKRGESLFLPFSSVESSVAAERLPTQPIAWCAYDLVVIDGPIFVGMSEKQLDALARWLEAGGSAAIFAEAPLVERHLAFLRRLAAEDGVTLELDEQSRLKLPSGEVQRLASGLGRVLLTNKNLADEKDFERGVWRSHVGWLWKLARFQQTRVDLDGTWSKDWPYPEDGGNYRGPYQQRMDRSERASLLGAWLRSGAMGFSDLSPDRPRPLPLGLVAALLGVLLFVAGPIDWFILGWLRRRRWTWVFFSLLCVLAAWLATQMAARYIGRQGRTGLVRIVDVGPDNRIFRETRVELSMQPNDVEWRTETVDGLSLALYSSDPTNLRANRNQMRFDPDPPVVVPVVPSEWASEWAGPSRYVQRQNLRQWTPAWRQSLSFPTQSDPAMPDWSKMIADYRANPARPARATSTEPPSGVRYFCFTPDDIPRIVNNDDWSAPAGEVSWPLARVLFSSETGATTDLVASDSPAPASEQVHGVRLTHPLGILAWRAHGHDLHIYRRHVSKRELVQKP